MTIKIGVYEIGFNKRRIWANKHTTVTLPEGFPHFGIKWEPNVCSPINIVWRNPIGLIRKVSRVWRGKYPFDLYLK